VCNIALLTFVHEHMKPEFVFLLCLLRDTFGQIANSSVAWDKIQVQTWNSRAMSESVVGIHDGSFFLKKSKL
jgi:hypothetical protein